MKNFNYSAMVVATTTRGGLIFWFVYYESIAMADTSFCWLAFSI